jgi:hypothetical protein
MCMPIPKTTLYADPPTAHACGTFRERENSLTASLTSTLRIRSLCASVSIHAPRMSHFRPPPPSQSVLKIWRYTALGRAIRDMEDMADGPPGTHCVHVLCVIDD